MNFNEIIGTAEGWLEIIKVTNGEEETVFSDKNVVCSGMGVTLAGMFSATGVDVSSYQVNLFQVGSSGTTALQVSSTGRLGNALTDLEIGTNSLMGLNKTAGTIVSGTTSYTDEAFMVLPAGYIDRIDSRTARWNLHIDENTCNGSEINEIGMFSNNPAETNPSKSWLCAYRFFGDITNADKGIWKSNQFSLIFRWTITF